ncbi:MAG: hypothetical protein IKR25_01980 [Muribaculaceae bacterium]|nr:hypothetical protein [Muribaculaceae bacterium]
MKTIKILILAFFAVLLIGCSDHGSDASNKSTVKPSKSHTTILLQPLGDFSQKEALQLKQELEKRLVPMVDVHIDTIKLLPAKPLQKEWFNAAHTRYRGNIILKSLAPKEKHTTIIALMHNDISTNLHGYDDWGVLGLSMHCYHSCVVSTYRLGSKNRLWQTACHEFIHTYYHWPHCPKDNPDCIMRDAKGKGDFRGKTDLCDYCKNLIGR